MIGETFDEWSQRIFGSVVGKDDDGGEDTNLRIVRTLGPGIYFLRVEGSGSAEGGYLLRVETVAW